MYFTDTFALNSARGHGQLVLFGLGGDRQVYVAYPMEPQDPRGWICIGGSLLSLHGNLNNSGDLEIFGRGTDPEHPVWHSWEDASSETGWHPWVSLGNPPG